MRLSDARSDATSSISEQSAKPSWPDWSGQTVVCVASGPSLTLEQIEICKASGAPILAINDVGLKSRLPISIPECDCLYAADDSWWLHYAAELRYSLALKIAAYPPKGLWDLGLDAKRQAFEWEPGKAVSGGHSGFQALQIAINAGASKVLLVGYDCKPSGKKTNYFGVKPPQLHRSSTYNQWPAWYRKLRVALSMPIEIVNCTPGSAITAFRYGDLGEELWK